MGSRCRRGLHDADFVGFDEVDFFAQRARLTDRPRAVGRDPVGHRIVFFRRDDRLQCGRIQFGDGTSGEKPRERKIDAGHGELSEGLHQLIQIMARRFGVGRRRDVRFASENLSDEVGQHIARADFDEDARAVGVHAFNLFDKPHAADQVVGQGFEQVLFVGRIRGGEQIGVNWNRWFLVMDRLEFASEKIARRLNDRRMKRATDGNKPAL